MYTWESIYVYAARANVCMSVDASERVHIDEANLNVSINI